MVKIGFLSAILPDKSLEEVLKFAADNQFECAEIACWPVGKAERRYAGITHIDVDSLTDEKVSEITKLMKTHVPISALAYYPNPMVGDDQQSKYIVNHMKKVIHAANILGIGKMNTFVGRDHTKNVEENFARFEQIWPDIISYAESEGVKIGIENCPMYFSDDEWPGGKNLAYCPQNWRRMFEMIPSDNFGLNYDPSHMIWQQMDYIQPMYDFADKLFHVHVKDVKVQPHRLNQVGIMANPLEYHSPKLPGLGDIDWGAFFTTLNSIGYSGPACIEVEDRSYESSEEDIEASILQSLRYVKQFIP
ncbi:MAG: sugar phosphate isomerase/epimerase family protein [Spirochaetota bacterium]